MQETSPEFETAVANHRTWVPPLLRVDWEGTGYAGDGSLDDLSGQMGETWEVDHTLDDGYPDSVTFVSGTSVPEFSTDLMGRTFPSPVPVSTTAPWTGSTANGVSTASTATLAVPAGVLHPGDWLFLILSIDSSTSTIASDHSDTDLPMVAGPTLDTTAMQTVVYARRVSQAIADDGESYTFQWTTASRYTLVGASIGARDAAGRVCVMELVAASQTNETLSSVTDHTTPTVASSAEYNVIVSLWARATTQSLTWTMAAGDNEAIEVVGASGSSNNLDVAIGYGSTIEDAGSYARTATTSPATSNATMAIVALSVPTWDAMTSAAWWSPARTDSPLYGRDRDIPPVTFDMGLVTEAGVERVRVFTGQMVNTAVRGGQAKLQTISAARLKLMKLVQPPAFAFIYAGGLYATWPVSYALVQCGIYAGPQIRSGTAWYAPMHGSAWQMIPAGNPVFTAAELVLGTPFPSWQAYQYDTDGQYEPLVEVPWITGPYVSAPDLGITATLRRAIYTLNFHFDADADDAFSQAGNAARLEMWVKGDATDVNGAPGASASRLCSLWGAADTGSLPTFKLGITPTKHVEVQVYDGTNTRTLTSTGTLPADGAWYFIGAGYDMTADRLWVNLGGTVESSTATMSTSGLPATDTWIDPNPVFLAVLPVAEVTLTTGVQANADLYPLWRDDASFAPTATLHPSSIKLNALAESEPREAWQIITDYAKAELASVRLTESDRFEYLPIGWWVLDDQQVVNDLFATDLNAAGFDIDLDPTKIRNSIKVSYNELTVVEYQSLLGGYQEIFELADTGVPIPIAPGVTVIKFTYGGLGVLPLQNFTLWDNSPIVGANITQATLNDVIDGTGTYATGEQVQITFDAWDAGSATLRFTNLTAFTWYVVNNSTDGFSPLIIVGLPIIETSTYVTDLDTASVTARGERGLDVSAQVLQTEESARRLARNIKMALRKAVATVGADQQGVEVTGNPARQPGDLATFRDDVTGVQGGLWRLRGVYHKGDGAQYRQEVVARTALPIMIIGEGLVGESLIGPPQD